MLVPRLKALVRCEEDIAIYSRVSTVGLDQQYRECKCIAIPGHCMQTSRLGRTGSKDDLGDFSKDSLQEALGNANLLHEKGS